MKSCKMAITCSALALAGCSTGSTVRYAQPGDVIVGGSSFATQDVKRFVLVNGTVSLKDQTIEISISNDAQTVFVTQNHKDYVLVYDGIDTYRSANAMLYREVIGAGVVETIFFSENTSGYYNGGSVVIGYQTNPTQVADRSGSATYNGYTYLTARTPTLGGFAEGAVTLNANFNTGKVTGTMNIIDSAVSSADFVVPNALVAINPGNTQNINGNRFNTNMNITLTPAPGDTISVDQAGLTGGFYGVDAAAVGATYWGTGSYNGEALFIEGALASNN